MKLPDFSLRNRTVTLFALFLIFAGGLFAYFNMGKLANPVFTIKTALVVTPYPVASPGEVDQQVTRVIEEYVQAADEVKTIRSTSRAGVSMVYVENAKAVMRNDPLARNVCEDWRERVMVANLDYSQQKGRLSGHHFFLENCKNLI